MDKITVYEAQKKVYELLYNEYLGDRVYEFAQNLFNKYINWVELKNEIIDKDVFESSEEWYDEIREDFFETVYEKLIDYLTLKS